MRFPRPVYIGRAIYLFRNGDFLHSLIGDGCLDLQSDGQRESGHIVVTCEVSPNSKQSGGSLEVPMVRESGARCSRSDFKPGTTKRAPPGGGDVKKAFGVGGDVKKASSVGGTVKTAFGVGKRCQGVFDVRSRCQKGVARAPSQDPIGCQVVLNSSQSRMA